ncbi:ROK family protein [Niabella beijingensis]|uniref:ROK family protein n=1 Tax=Niabella beijingensis TaxID=2872700 RepID=UPI001CC00938|nr:ROK family protein [Niabella beijingensis]MBZ4192273.1 ROK family protein [Niabella beijingensis]
MNSCIALGVDIGGTHITASLVDLEKRIIIDDSLKREEVASTGPSDMIFDSWVDLLTRVMDYAGNRVEQIGIAMPGPFDYKSGISLIKEQDKFRNLYGLNVGDILSGRLGINRERIVFKNDAVCFLRGEMLAGSLKGYESAIGITLGTGLGTAAGNYSLEIDAGLWNMPFKNGIAEDFLSTKWFVSRFYTLSGKSVSGVKELLKQYNNNKNIDFLFDEFARNLALFISEFLKKFPSEAVVIGGNINKAFARFQSQVQTLLWKKIGRRIPIVNSELGEYSALIGAALF